MIEVQLFLDSDTISFFNVDIVDNTSTHRLYETRTTSMYIQLNDEVIGYFILSYNDVLCSSSAIQRNSEKIYAFIDSNMIGYGYIEWLDRSDICVEKPVARSSFVQMSPIFSIVLLSVLIRVLQIFLFYLASVARR